MKTTDETSANPTTTEGQREENAAVRVVRRYPNRRLYDSGTRAYVQLQAIAQWIDDGQVVQIIEQRTGLDVTATVLGPLLLEQLERGLKSYSAPELCALLRWAKHNDGFHVSAVTEAKEAPLVTEITAPHEELETRVARLEHTLRELLQQRTTAG